MPWLAITLQAESRVADALADALMAAGALSVSCDDADAGTPAEAAQFGEPGETLPHMWHRNVLTALVDVTTEPGRLVQTAAGACEIEAPAFTVSTVADEDWVRNTQMQFEPLPIAQGLWIIPSWCTPPDPSAVNIRIDPGLAFGTGSHATTRLMLRWLARTLSKGETLLDYGCGSGILAITAARLGAVKATGVDIDPQALVAANDNAAKNQVDARFFLPDAAPDGPFDIVVANILASPLIVLAPLLTAHTRKRIALSGVLAAQYDEVAAAYCGDFVLEEPDRDDGWILVTGLRR